MLTTIGEDILRLYRLFFQKMRDIFTERSS